MTVHNFANCTKAFYLERNKQTQIVIVPPKAMKVSEDSSSSPVGYYITIALALILTVGLAGVCAYFGWKTKQ